MRYIYLIVPCVVLLVACMPQKPILEVKNDMMEIGNIQAGDTTKIVYYVSNIGNAPLLIKNISSSCGCIHVEWTKQPIYPDNEGKVEVLYTSSSQEHGPVERTLAIESNAKPIIKVLKFRAKLIAPLTKS